MKVRVHTNVLPVVSVQGISRYVCETLGNLVDLIRVSVPLRCLIKIYQTVNLD